MPKDVRIQCQLFRNESRKICGRLRKTILRVRARNKWDGESGVTQFSDSFVVYVEDRKGGKGVFRDVLIEIGGIYWDMLCKAMPIRGVVVYGEATAIEQGSVCGGILKLLESAEKDYARYARISFVGESDRYRDFPLKCNADGLTLDVLDADIIARTGKASPIVGRAELAAQLSKLKERDRPEVFKKTIETLRMLEWNGIQQVVFGNSIAYVDGEKFLRSDPYPRLRPADYFVAYLTIEHILSVGEVNFDGFVDQDNGQVDALVQRIVLYFTNQFAKIKGSPGEVYGATLMENRALTRSLFCANAKRLKCGVQQIGNHILVWTKDDCVVAPFALAYALGELAVDICEYITTGSFVRGAVVYGPGWNIDQDVLYGPVVASAYHDLMKDCHSLRVRFSPRAKSELQSNALVSCYAEGAYPCFTKDCLDDSYRVDFRSRCLRDRIAVYDGDACQFQGENWKQWRNTMGMLSDFVKRVDVCKMSSHNLTRLTALREFLDGFEEEK